MLRLKLRLVAKQDWVKYFDEPSGGTIFCPTTTPPAVGTALQLEAMFQGGPRLIMRGVVLWRRATGDARARAGVGVGVHAADRQKIEYIHAYVAGEPDRRYRRRLPIRLRVTYTARQGRRIHFTRHRHEEGVFVRSAELLTPGDETRLLISPPGGEFKPIEARGQVVRLVEEEPDRGMGIALIFKDSQEKQHFADFVRKLEQQYLSGSLPDEAIS